MCSVCTLAQRPHTHSCGRAVAAVAVLLRCRGLLMSAADHTKTPLVPLSATSSTKSRWQPVQIVQGIVNIKGGYNKRGEASQSMQYRVGDITHVFVELDKNAAWFLKGVGGAKVQKGDLKPVLAIQLLRERLQQKIDGESGTEAAVGQGHLSAVAGSQSESQEPDEDIDPMEEMDDLVDVAPQAKKKPKAKAKPNYPCRAAVEEFEVPTRPRCAGCGHDDKTVVYVYKKASLDKRGNGNLWLRLDCIEWLLAYAADELHFQGVPQSTPEPATRQVGNCPAVADLSLELDFSAKAWDAKFVAGALAGTAKRMGVNDLDRDVWEKLREQSIVHVYFGHATSIQKKDALKEFITLWCAASARNEVGEFEATMSSPATSSPPRGAKRVWETAADDTAFADTAVADTAGDGFLPDDDIEMLG